jgi:hypothetical protein
MKTLADFKRRIKPGVIIHGIFHRNLIGRDENNKCVWGNDLLGERVVSVVQTNAFALKTIRKDGTIMHSWCTFPKASQLRIVDEDTVTIMEQDDRTKESYSILTYKFITTP